MRFHFQFRRYRVAFRTPVRTAHGWWKEREGVIVRLQDVSEGGSGLVGLGEAAPIPWFGTETVDEVEEGCRSIGEWVEDSAFEAIPTRLACLRNAVAAARAQAGPRARVEEEDAPAPVASARVVPAALGVAALLPAGPAALTQIPPKAEMGFRIFKWKVGVGDIADELVLLDDVCAALPSGAKLRLDANGAWDRRRAERWLERCADRPIEFVEQPCFADAAQGETAQRRNDDLLLGLAGNFPTPLALDESLIGENDLERWIGVGWPGVFVIKPSLMADIEAAMSQLEKARASVVFSSALETAVGARAALRGAFAWSVRLATPPAAKSGGEAPTPAPTSPQRTRALGFGVWPLFADARFDGPYPAPFLRMDDVDRINVEAVWNALS